MREKALGVQAGVTSVANEVVVLVMVGGAESTTTHSLRRPVGSSSWPGTTSMDPRQPSLGWPDVRPHASNRIPVTQGAVGLEKSRATTGESGEGERGDWRRRWEECGRCGSVYRGAEYERHV
jgi:hypothetical protein